MSPSDFAANLLAWTLQSSLIFLVGFGLPRFLRLDPPGLRLRYWQALLVFALLIPALTIERTFPLALGGETITARWLESVAAAPDGAQGMLSGTWLALGLLAAGALARMAWILGGLYLLARRAARATAFAPAPALGEIAGLGEARLLLSEEVHGPVTFGLRRAAILLPPHFPTLPLATQRGVLCHELEHVRRGDWLSILAEETLRAVLWFHPGVWLVLDRIELAREQVVDDAVVRRTGQRRAYLEALWSLACHPGLGAPSLPFLNRGHLRARVAQLTQEIRMSRSRALAATIAFACLLALTAAGSAMLFPFSAQADGGTKAAAPSKAADDAITRPVRISGPAPVYPESAKNEKIQGNSVLRVTIGTDGKVRNPKVISSAGHPDLDQAAIDAVEQWLFKPATLNGENVEVEFTVTLRFQLE